MAKAETQKKSDLQKHIDKLVKTHGGLRPASRALAMDPGYLWRLQKGRLSGVSDETLAKLGLRRIERLVPL
jgi:hypothetical protein